MGRNTGKRRRRVLAVALGTAVFGVVVASAASLGAITTNQLAAGTQLIAGCDSTGVSVAYTSSYSVPLSAYVVTTVTVSAIDAACVGATMSVTLQGAAGADIGGGSATVAGASQAVTVSPTPPAADVVGVAIAIG